MCHGMGWGGVGGSCRVGVGMGVGHVGGWGGVCHIGVGLMVGGHVGVSRGCV